MGCPLLGLQAETETETALPWLVFMQSMEVLHTEIDRERERAGLCLEAHQEESQVCLSEVQSSKGADRAGRAVSLQLGCTEAASRLRQVSSLRPDDSLSAAGCDNQSPGRLGTTHRAMIDRMSSSRERMSWFQKAPCTLRLLQAVAAAAGVPQVRSICQAWAC